jgi:hypothetical protein
MQELPITITQALETISTNLLFINIDQA